MLLAGGVTRHCFTHRRRRKQCAAWSWTLVHLLLPPLLQDEIVKVQKRREERELDKVRQEEELQFLARERAIAEGAELDKKEELVGAAASSCAHRCHC